MIAAKQLLRRARTLLWTTLSILIVLAAMLVGLGKLLMPYSDRFQPRLEAWLSEEFGQKVTLASFEGEWNAFGPRLALEGLRLQGLAGGAGDIVIESAALDIKPLNALIPGRALYSFLLIGADVRVTRSAEDNYVVSGVGISSTGEPKEVSGFRNLIGVGTLNLEDSRLEYVDESRGVHLQLDHIDARLQASDDQLAVSLHAEAIHQATGQAFGEVEAAGIFALNGEGGFENAEWQVTLREVLLSELQGRLPARPYVPGSGTVNGEFWGDWRSGAALRISGVLDVRDISFSNGATQVGIAQLNTLFKWERLGADAWRVDFAELQLGDGSQSWTAPSVTVARNHTEDVTVCPTCSGRGAIKSIATVCLEIFREIMRSGRQFEAKKLLVMAAPPVVAQMLDEHSATVAELEELIHKSIRFQTEEQYSQEQFDVVLL